MRTARTAAISALLLGVVASTSCIKFGRDPRAPDVVERYLRAIDDKDFGTAYRLTTLPGIHDGAGSGSALSAAHFEGFFRANLLTGHEIAKVTKLEQRSMSALNEKGTPHYVVDVRFTFPEGERLETLSVESEVLPKVQVDPDNVFLSIAADLDTVTVDGVRTSVDRQSSDVPYSLLVMRGRHTIEMSRAQPIVIDTTPLRVVSGPATVRDGRIVVGSE